MGARRPRLVTTEATGMITSAGDRLADSPELHVSTWPSSSEPRRSCSSTSLAIRRAAHTSGRPLGRTRSWFWPLAPACSPLRSTCLRRHENHAPRRMGGAAGFASRAHRSSRRRPRWAPALQEGRSATRPDRSRWSGNATLSGGRDAPHLASHRLSTPC